MPFLKTIQFLKNNGLALTIKEIKRHIVNKLFNWLVWGRSDIHVDSSARIVGRSHIKIGKNFTAGNFLWLEAVLSHGNERYSPFIVIKDNVSCNDFVHIGATNYVEIGNNVLLASDIYITDHNHGLYSGDNPSEPTAAPNHRMVNNDKRTIIGDNAWIGERVCVLPGVRIGAGSVIGAGAIVTKDVPENCIVVGNPAKVIKKYDFANRRWIST
jgi:lipopolysaccharide O-acetyltransferase